MQQSKSEITGCAKHSIHKSPYNLKTTGGIVSACKHWTINSYIYNKYPLGAGQSKELINTREKNQKVGNAISLHRSMLQKLFLFCFVFKVVLLLHKDITCHSDNNTGWQLKPMLQSLPRKRSPSPKQGIHLHLHSQRHLAAPGLARSQCSCCQLSQKEVTTISNFTHKQQSPWKLRVVLCCAALKSPTSPKRFPLL